MRHGFSELFLGETDRNGLSNPEAWRGYGFDLDGWSSAPQQGFHCKPQEGGKPSDIRTDGDNGIDNSFGRNIILNLFSTLVESPSKSFAEGIAQGYGTTVLDLGGLGAAESYSSLAGQYFLTLGQRDENAQAIPPGNDWSAYAWRPRADWLLPDGGAKEKFSAAYVSNHVWVSGGKSSLQFIFLLQGMPLSFPINHAVISLDVSNPKAGTMGNLGGVVPTTEMVSAFQKVASNLSSQFCDPNSTTLESILNTIRQSSDIMLDGSQDPTKECDGISLGMGFNTRATSLGEPVVTPPDPNPCELLAPSAG